MKKFLFLLYFMAFSSMALPAQSLYDLGPGKYPEFQAYTLEPGLHYGPAKGKQPLPKTILYIPITAQQL
ncbi:MAG: hypothetical protein GXO76_13985, partial [Calditrichaeota bacterium]|nr:hypothetical protein [Calditrichota bacterium]